MSGDQGVNPISKLQANQFTQVTNRDLDKPVNTREASLGPASEGTKMRKMHKEATAPGGSNAPQMGYAKPEGMSNEHMSWLMGGHHMFPNVAAEKNVPAINQPHEANPGVTVQRRAEDLTPGEMDKGKSILKHYGHDARDPLGSLKNTQDQNLQRVMGEHVAAGVEETSSQHFYGGVGVNTNISEQTGFTPEGIKMDAKHYTGMREANNRFQQGVSSIVDKMPQIEGVDKRSSATNMMAQATADTSPNTKWRTGKGGWPNMEQAEESVRAGLAGESPKFIAGRIQNHAKAADRVSDMAYKGDFGVHAYGNPKTAPKTVAFRGALVDQNAADAYKVSDVHEGSQAFPGLPTQKATIWKGGDDKTKTPFHPDQPKSVIAGKKQQMVTSLSGTIKAEKGNSRVEEALGKGPYVHALNDYATRQTLADHGLSRGVNYADNVHAMQGATWGSQQVKRPDVEVSHSSQYPVVRDWAAEGHTPEMTDLGNHMFGGRTRGLGAQFVENPNTKPSENAARKPYPIEG